MNLLDRMERSRFGRFGIPNLMKYAIAVNFLGAILGVFYPYFYFEYLRLDVAKVLHGEIWRIFTFVLSPAESIGDNPVMDMAWFAIWAVVFYSIGTNLEKMWGTFRFNFFYFGGLFLIVVMTFLYYLLLRQGWIPNTAVAYLDYMSSVGVLDCLHQTLFIAFACTLPNAQFLFYFVIPVRAKWFIAIYLVMDGYHFVRYMMDMRYYSAAVIAVLLFNFLLFYLMGKGSFSPRQAYRQRKRKTEYRKKASAPQRGPRHHCVICGRTEKDDPGLEFRYCSKCDGNYEYCSDHLFTHEHVHHD